MFREGLGGWKNGRKQLGCQFVEIFDLEVLIKVLLHHVWHVGKEVECSQKSDNYNILFLKSRICLVFSHENEMLMFSRDVDLLKIYAATFRKIGLSVNIDA